MNIDQYLSKNDKKLLTIERTRVRIPEKGGARMSLMMVLVPAALTLLVWGGVMAVSGLRRKSKLRLCSAAGAFALLAAGASVMMEFITRPL